MMEWELFVPIFRTILLLAFITYIINAYLKCRLKSLLFVILAFFSFFLSEVGMILIFVFENNAGNEISIESIGAIFAANTVMFGIMVSSYAFLLLLKSTEVNIIENRNVILTGILLVIISTTFLFSTIIASITIIDHIQGRTDLENIQQISITSIWTLWFYLLFFTIGFSLVVLFWTWKLLYNKQRTTTSDHKKHTLTMLLYTFRLLIIGSVMSTIGTFAQWTIITEIGILLSEIAFCMFTYIYIEKGISTLGNDNLRALMIVNSDGSLLYDYNFNGYGEQKENSLFSSAIRAVSIIIDEYTDSSEKLQAIQLEHSNLLIQTIDDELTILLLVNSATHYDKTRLVSFSSSIRNDIKSLHRDVIAEDDQNYLDNSIRNIFG